MLKRKRISSILLALVMLFSVMVALPKQASAATGFDDVGEDHAFYPFVNYAKDKGYVDGYVNGNYGPEDSMTRAQVAKLLVNAKGLEVDEDAKDTGAFKDTDSHALEPWIAASKDEIFDGDLAGNFLPEDKILRGQAAKVVVNALGLELKADKAIDFEDVPAGHEFADEIAILSSQGIVSGDQDKFSPEDELTRGAFAKYVVNAATIPAALAAVEKAEETEDEADVRAAKELVNALPDETVAADLNDRLDDVLLLVDSVSAIDKTITLNVAVFEAEEDAKAKVEVFKLDKDGVRVTPAYITATNLAIEEDEVIVDLSSKDFGDAEYEVVVTIAGKKEEINVNIEFKAVETLLSDIKKASTAQLATLLNNETYFTGFDAALVDAYKANVDSNKAPTDKLKTLANVQKLVLDAAKGVGELEAFRTEVDKLTTKFAKFNLLKERFENVLDVNMDEYINDAGTTIFQDKATNENKLVTTLTTMKNVQDAIDAINKTEQDKVDKANLDAVVADFGASLANFYATPTAAPEEAKLNELQAALSALEELEMADKTITDTTNSKTQAQLIKDIEDQIEATNEAIEEIEKLIIKANAAMDAHIVAGGAAADTKYVALETEVDKFNDLDLTKVAEEDLSTIITAIGDVDGSAALKDLLDATLELTIINDTLVAVDEFKAAFKVNNDTDFKLQTVYTDIFGGADPILVETSPGSGEYGFGTDSSSIDYTSADLTTLLTALEKATAEWVLYNDVMAATTAEELRDLLFGFGEADYTNLKAAQKLEVAEIVLEMIKETPLPTDHTALANILGDTSGGAIKAFTDLLSSVNGAGDISTMIINLETIEALDFFEGFKGFTVLTPQAKAQIAENVLEGKAYTLIADIVAAMGL